ncbi:MAG: hypothetical protein JWO82_1729 [Akkermansiaceae bacterium]|nr:hypothetical protein [Akkermansiaceae bacterium]
MSFILPACPLLPGVEDVLDPSVTRQHSDQKGPDFYLAALRYAQSLWRQGKPAQAILQLNKSFMAGLTGDEPVLQDWPAPYAPLIWFLRHRQPDAFVGNPVRHFQHLATRVVGDLRELRSWRAWACFHLSKAILPPDEFPPDHDQIGKESLILPGWPATFAAIHARGWHGESATLLQVAEAIGLTRPPLQVTDLLHDAP